MTFALHVSVWLSLMLVVPAAAFLIRTFIVFHDCTHGSFMRSRRANNVLGAALGLLVWLPFRGWQHDHAVHHATAGDLDRRGVGDVATLTVSEYQALSPRRKIAYRLFRSPLVMFGVGVGGLAWMMALTGVMVVEKTSRQGRRLVPIVGTTLLVWGGLIALRGLLVAS